MFTLNFSFRVVHTLITLFNFECWPTSFSVQIVVVERKLLGQVNPSRRVWIRLLEFDWERAVAGKPSWWQVRTLFRFPRSRSRSVKSVTGVTKAQAEAAR